MPVFQRGSLCRGLIELMCPVHSLSELELLGVQNSRYADLAEAAAVNLGAVNVDTFSDAMSWLEQKASDVEGMDAHGRPLYDGSGESGVVDNVNFLLWWKKR